MIRRSSRLLLEILAALLTGFIVLAGLAAWRLSQDEPVRLTFLTADLEDALTPQDGSFRVEIDDTVLTWGGWQRTVDLRATGVRVVEVGGRTIAAIPSISVTLSLRALLIHQLVAPTAIEIFEPRIFLVRERDGRFRFVHAATDDPAQAGEETSPVVARLLETLLAPPDPTQPTGYLKQASITRGQLTFRDRRADLTWHAPMANIVLVRHAEGILGRLDLTVERLGDPARFNATIDYDSGAQQLSLAGSFAGVRASAVAEIDPVLSRFTGADITLSGKLSSTIALDGRIGSTDFEVAGGPGMLTMPETLAAPLPIRRLAMVASYDPTSDRLALSRAALELDGPRLTLAGTVDGVHAGAGSVAAMRIAAQVTAENFPLAELPRYWPPKVRPNPRTWIADHVSSGVAERAEADIALVMPGGNPAATVIERFEGTIKGSGLTVHYLDPLPPVEGASGTARFTHKEFSAGFTQGHVQGIEITGGTLRISGLQERDQTIDINGALRGPLAEALAILDNPRLGYAKKLGIAPESTAGDTSAELSFRFPAKKGLTFDQVDVTAKAEIRDAAIDKAMLGQDLKEGKVELELDRTAMTMSGSGNFGGAPIEFQWEENFGKADFIRKITAHGVLSADQRAAFGHDYRPRVDGPIETTVEYTRLPKKRAQVTAKLNLTTAMLKLADLNWEKKPGVPGEASILLDLVDERIRAIPDFSIVAADLAASGKAQFGANGNLDRLQFNHLRLGKTDLRSVTVALAGGRADIVIGGGEVDVQPLRGNHKAERTQLPPFTLQAAHLRRLHLAPDRSLRDVSVSLRHDGAHWDEIALDATLPEDKPLSVRFEPAGGRHQLSITSPDAGATLRAFNIADSVKGGRLVITGQSDDDAPGRPIVGKAEIGEFRLLRSSVLTRLLTMATLTGFVDVMTGEGFQFNRFESDFTKTEGRLDFELARAHGPSLGITGTGHVDFDRDAVDIEGTVVPAYALNSVLNEIPILGFILTGGEGEGMFAVTYHATGPVEEPNFSVNPLSALTPGFLRGLFDIVGDGNDGQRPPLTALPPRMGTNK